MSSPHTRWPLGRIRRRLLGVLRLTAIVLLCVWLFAMLFENSLIYYPDRHPVGEWNPPGLTFEDAYFESKDGTRIHGWYCPSPNPRAVVLFAHGNAGNLSHRWPLMRMWQKRFGVTIMMFDYRGYGRSEGSPHEAGLLSDARAARKWLSEHANIPQQDIVLVAESLGGGVMVDLAASDGARGLILENTFTSIPDVAAHHMPWLPVRLLLRTRFDSVNKIKSYQGPLLQVHGNADQIVPYELGKRLFETANEPKRLVTVELGDHNDPPTEAYLTAIDEFLDQLPPSN